MGCKRDIASQRTGRSLYLWVISEKVQAAVQQVIKVQQVAPDHLLLVQVIHLGNIGDQGFWYQLQTSCPGLLDEIQP